jgi:hypothetical protein
VQHADCGGDALSEYVAATESGYYVAGTRVSLDSIVYAFLGGQTAEATRDTCGVHGRGRAAPGRYRDVARGLDEPHLLSADVAAHGLRLTSVAAGDRPQLPAGRVDDVIVVVLRPLRA